jgi:hypothetical protein
MQHLQWYLSCILLSTLFFFTHCLCLYSGVHYGLVCYMGAWFLLGHLKHSVAFPTTKRE